MTVPFIGMEAEAKLDWIGLTEAFVSGHARARAQLTDTFLYRDSDTLLSRAAWIDGMGIAVKNATVFPANAASGQPTTRGVVNLLGDDTGGLEALLDFQLVTKWKTAGDSLLGALRLARPDSRTILIVGAGTVARNLRQAYGAGFPDADFLVWNRSPGKAEAFADAHPKTRAMADLAEAVAEADIVTSATMSKEPFIKGEWFRPGQHIDLIGAFRPDMREADDAALSRARIFVDNFDTTVGHIGEIMIPLETGVIRREDVLADYYDLGAFRRERDDITLFKNGGGAHLDLMTCRYILSRI